MIEGLHLLIRSVGKCLNYQEGVSNLTDNPSFMNLSYDQKESIRCPY